MTHTPYSPYGQPAQVASVPSSPDPQGLIFSMDTDAGGDNVIVSLHTPFTVTPTADAGLYFRLMNHLGATSNEVLVELFDYDDTDHFTSSISDAHVSMRDDGGFWIGFVRRVGHSADLNDPTDWYTDTFVVRDYDANGNQLLAEQSFATVLDDDLYDGTHYAITKPTVGADNLGGVTGAWQVVTDVDYAPPIDASSTTELRVSRFRYDALGNLNQTPSQLLASSFLDRGDGSFSQYNGNFILSHDLDTNASGQNVVVWDLHHTTETHVTSAYLTLEKIRRLRIDEYGTILVDANPDYVNVSQNADTWEASPVPKVTMNDSGQYAIAWTYAPDYAIPQWQLTAERGIYTRFYNWNAPITNEIKVVSSPNSDGRPSYPTPPQFYVSHPNHPIAMNNDGKVMVGYNDSSSQTSVTPHRLRGQLFNVDGTRIGDRFSFVEAYWPYGQTSVVPEQFRLSMDENAHITAAWGNPDTVPDTWATVLAQRFVRVEFDVQHGEVQRNTVQYVDFTFNPGMVDVASLLNAGRVQLIQYPLNGSQQGTPISLTGVLSVSGNTLTMNFGAQGLANGYYKAFVDLDGDGVFEMVRAFYRMQGDFSGTGLNNNPWIHFYLND